MTNSHQTAAFRRNKGSAYAKWRGLTQDQSEQANLNVKEPSACAHARRDADMPAPVLPEERFRNLFFSNTSKDAYQHRFRPYPKLNETVGHMQGLTLKSCHPAHEMQPNRDPNGLPAGYTYLGQIIAHDIGKALELPFDFEPDSHADLTPQNARETAEDTPREPAQDAHIQPLTLCSVFGAHLAEEHLRKDNAAAQFPVYEFPRNADGEGKCFDLWRGDENAPSIADLRNDDTPMVAQMSALFIALANRLTKIALKEGIVSDPVCAFRIARILSAEIFRDIVKYDFLKHILQEEVFAYYDDSDVQKDVLIDKNHSDAALPIELNQSVLRFGHALVQSFYQLNAHTPPVLINRLLRGETNIVGIRKDDPNFWQIDWAEFFDLGQRPPQKARPISHNLSKYFVNLQRFEIEEAADASDEWKDDLMMRDLARGAECGILKLSALAEITKPFFNGNFKNALAFQSQDVIADEIAKILGDKARLLDPLYRDPPLYFFTLIEASLPKTKGGGEERRLGVLGSIVLAESILGICKTPVKSSRIERRLAGVLAVHLPLPMRKMEDLIHYINDQKERKNHVIS